MIKLISYKEDHLPKIYLWHAEPGMDIKIGLVKPPGIKETVNLVESWIKDERSLLRMIDHNGQIIGYVRFAGICSEHGFCEVHTLVGEKKYQGTKVCVEVEDEALIYAFENLKLHHVGTFVLGNNPRLYKTALKYGFKLEGTMRQLIRTGTGERVDYHIFGILKEEFKRRS